MKTIFSIFLVWLIVLEHNAEAVPTPQVFTPLTPSLRPVSEIFYAVTRGPNDPLPPFVTVVYTDNDHPIEVIDPLGHEPTPAINPEPPRLSPQDQHEDIGAQQHPPPQPQPTLPQQQPSPVAFPSPTIPATLSNRPIPASLIQSLLATNVPSSSPLITPQAEDPSPTTTVDAPPLPSGDESSGKLDDAAKKPKKLSTFPIVAIVVGTLAALSLCIFMLVDPRVSQGCRKRRAKSYKGLGTRPISSWFPFPASAPPGPSSASVTRKAVATSRRGLEFETSDFSSVATTYPRSKFSITSSDYSQASRMSGSSTDTVLVENTRANGSIPPVRPPRPPTADSPATMSDSVFLAPENQIYLEPSFIVSGLELDDPGDSASTVVHDTRTDGVSRSRKSPLLPPATFFTLPSVTYLSTLGAGVDQPFRRRDVAGSLSTSEETRHSRTHSAPIYMGNPVDDSYQPIFIDPVARKVMEHRRSRSNSGWAYPRRVKSTSDEESYHGVFGEAV